MTNRGVYPIELGALVRVPIHNDHKRAKNWLAVVRMDPKSPSGLARRFQARAHGRFYYLVDGIKPGDVLEFGADYYTGSGRKDARRVYGVVVSITDGELVMDEYQTASEAFTVLKTMEADGTESKVDHSGESGKRETDLSTIPTEDLIAELERRGVRIKTLV